MQMQKDVHTLQVAIPEMLMVTALTTTTIAKMVITTTT